MPSSRSNRRCWIGLASVALCGLLSLEVDAQGLPVPDYTGDLFDRAQLTGDWWGARTALGEAGITANLYSTQYFQGVTSGGLDQGFEFGGRNDYFINFDGERLGLSQGSFVTLHAETRYGERAGPLAGALLPVNFGLATPQPDGQVTAITGLRATQFLSENFLVFAGKINTFDDFKQPITNAGVTNGFMNSALMFNPVLIRSVPYSTLGAGFAVLRDMEPILSGMVLDTRDNPVNSGFDTFFENGVSLVLAANLPTQLAGLPGHHGLTGVYTNGRYTGLDASIYLDPDFGPLLVTTEETGTWCLAYNFDQALYVDPNNPRNKWGVFANLGIADDNPSPVEWTASVGLSGTNPYRADQGDTFGVGYFHTGTSGYLSQLPPPVGFQLEEGQGIELYYNFAVTRWFQITPDFQVVDPARTDADTAVILGLRSRIEF
jgi:porin